MPHYQSLKWFTQTAEFVLWHTAMTNNDYGKLVAADSDSEAIHRWFHVKEGFSSRLLQHVLVNTGLYKLPSLSLLDSFVGGGTTVVSALSLDERIETQSVIAYGIECNPFLRFVAQTKVRALKFGAPNFPEYIQCVVGLSQCSKVTAGQVPKLSTFH